MESREWLYYNHAFVSALPPHQTPDTSVLHSRRFWRSSGGRALFATWTDGFDCGSETEWWYCICDKPFDMQALKSKRRNVVKNALKYCTVQIGDPLEHEEALFAAYTEAQRSYAAVNRQEAQREAFHRSMQRLAADDAVDVYICFIRETNEAAGYAVVKNGDGYCAFQSQKVKPSLEKYQVNAALVHAILSHYADRLGSDFYVCDGARSINHITHFQDYLEKYFGFRKAYCRLHMYYRLPVRLGVRLLYPFRRQINKRENNRLLHQLSAVLRMEEIRRSFDG